MTDQITEALRAGWQKVADITGATVHVFRGPKGQLLAVTNARQGHGDCLAVIHPSVEPVQPNTDAHGLGAVPGGALYEPPAS